MRRTRSPPRSRSRSPSASPPPASPPPAAHSKASLERTILFSRAESIERDRRELANQRVLLRQERRQLAVAEAALEADQKLHADSQNERWAAPLRRQREDAEAAQQVTVSVGGQTFITTRRVLCREPGSRLARAAAVMDTIAHDRDWWLFRYVLNFLRDGLLPSDTATLDRLYQEADFWRLESLKQAIEERGLRVFRRAARATGSEPGQLSRRELQVMAEGERRSHPRAGGKGGHGNGGGGRGAGARAEGAGERDWQWWEVEPAWWLSSHWVPRHSAAAAATDVDADSVADAASGRPRPSRPPGSPASASPGALSPRSHHSVHAAASASASRKLKGGEQGAGGHGHSAADAAWYGSVWHGTDFQDDFYSYDCAGHDRIGAQKTEKEKAEEKERGGARGWGDPLADEFWYDPGCTFKWGEAPAGGAEGGAERKKKEADAKKAKGKAEPAKFDWFDGGFKTDDLGAKTAVAGDGLELWKQAAAKKAKAEKERGGKCK
jgi:hypothetical protein